MSILSKLTKISAAMAMSASFATFLPATAQTSTAVQQTSASVLALAGQNRFRGRRGFSSRRGFSNSRRGFSNSRRSRSSSFNRRGSSFNRGFRGNSFSNRSFRRGSSFNRGFSSRGFNRGFSSRSFNRGFRGNSFRRGGFGLGVGVGVAVVAPIYSVGGFYGITSNTVIISNFGAHGLYAPPRGYHWVCDKGSHDAVLAAVATGAIIAVAANSLATPY